MRYLNEKQNYDPFDRGDLFNDFFELDIAEFGRNKKQMKTDIIKEEDKYIIKVDIPGYRKEDIKVHVGDRYLTVHAKKTEEDRKVEGSYVYQERFLGTASRSFYIGNISEDKIRARYENGTLIIDVPRTEKEQDSKRWLDIK